MTQVIKRLTLTCERPHDAKTISIVVFLPSLYFRVSQRQHQLLFFFQVSIPACRKDNINCCFSSKSLFPRVAKTIQIVVSLPSLCLRWSGPQSLFALVRAPVSVCAGQGRLALVRIQLHESVAKVKVQTTDHVCDYRSYIKC